MNEISHKGRIVSVGAEVTEVEILQTSACASCHARNMCGYSDEKKKIVPVPTNAFAMLKEGDEVELCMKSSMGFKAVWISYVIPLVVMVAAVLVCYMAGVGELASGLVAIGSLVLYYALVFCFRKKLENEFVFYIK